MRPVLFRWRGHPVWSYPALCYAGLVLGLTAQNAAANAAGLGSARVYLATLILVPITILGHRLLFVAMHWPTYRRDPRRIWRRPEGGMAMYGAVPSVLPASLPLLVWLAVPYWEFWDASVFCILVIMVAARLGCFLHGCCGGRVTDGWLALPLPDAHGARAQRVPTQLLEIAWTLVLLAGAIAAWPHLETPGTLLLATVAGYGLGRVALQPTRAVRERLGGVDVSLALWGGTGLLAVVWLMARA